MDAADNAAVVVAIVGEVVVLVVAGVVKYRLPSPHDRHRTIGVTPPREHILVVARRKRGAAVANVRIILL
jgi:hypothetical protein